MKFLCEGGGFLEPGDYLARLSDAVESAGKFGPQIKFIFELVDFPDAQPQWGFASSNWKRGSKAREWCTILAGREFEDGETIDTDKLIGKLCILRLVRLDNGKGNKVDMMLPPGGHVEKPKGGDDEDEPDYANMSRDEWAALLASCSSIQDLNELRVAVAGMPVKKRATALPQIDAREKELKALDEIPF